MADGSRGRVSKYMDAAGQVFSGYGVLRGFLVAGPAQTLQLRNGAADGDVLIRIPNHTANHVSYVMCDIVFGNGLYVTVGSGDPDITLFYD